MKLFEVLEKDEEVKYHEWKKLVNMSTAELKKFINSNLGKEAGLNREQAKQSGGIKRGRDSARAILRMRSKPFSDWDENDKDWMGRQISFISRMTGNKGPMLDEKSRPTRKLTSLWIWGNVPKGLKPTKYMNKDEEDEE